MNAFRPEGRKIFETKVPLESGAWCKLSTGTTDRHTAKAIDRMIDDLGPMRAHAWDILAMVTAPKAPWSLSDLYRYWASVPSTKRNKVTGVPIPPSPHERMEAIRARIRDQDLIPLLDAWHKVLVGPSRGVSKDTAAHYRSAVRGFFLNALELDQWSDVEHALAEDAESARPIVLASQFTEQQLRVYVEEMDDVEPATVRKRGIGIRDFGSWLVGRGVFVDNPMADVPLPPPGDPLTHYIETPDVMRLADAQPGQYRLYGVILPGTAMEVSTALTVRIRSISVDDKSIHAPGTKAYNRDRIVRVADYAWDAVLEAMQGKHPDSLLFDQVTDRWIALDHHTAARRALVDLGHRVYAFLPNGLPHDYTMRDHRHTWAVRAIASGWSIEAVRIQLGHANGVLANKVYGKHQPRREDIERYEQLAAARDRQIVSIRKTQEGNR